MLVNNAGIYGPTPVFEIPDAEWRRYFEVKVMSGVRLARHHVPRMVGRRWGARDVHLQRVRGADPRRDGPLRDDEDRAGLDRPGGPTLSEGLETMLEHAREEGQSIEDAGRAFIAAARPTSLLGRPASPEEVANMVVFLA